MTANERASHRDCCLARRSVLAVAAALVAGCVDGQTASSSPADGVSDGARRSILDDYAAGQEARREASRFWIRGNDAWERNFFGSAATHWSRAEDRFGAAGRRFDQARSGCEDAGLQRGRDICSAARDYCEHMRASAEEHAAAAGAYEAGALAVGDRHLDSGYESYVTALDYRIASTDRLAEALEGMGAGPRQR